jgi:hypothetical protein
VVLKEIAQINFGETVAVKNQNRIGVQVWPRQTDGAASAKRLRFDDSLNLESGHAPREMLDDCLGAMAEREHHTRGPPLCQPIEQMIQIGAVRYGSEELGSIAKYRAYP